MGERQVQASNTAEAIKAAKVAAASKHGQAYSVALYEKDGAQIARVIVPRDFESADVLLCGSQLYVWKESSNQWVRATSRYIAVDSILE